MTAGQYPTLAFSFEADVIAWRGPSPFFFAPVPPAVAEQMRRIARAVTYGWGMIPVEATLGAVTFTTALFPKGETYMLPLKADVRLRTGVTVGDAIRVEMTVQPARR